jgi:UDP-3-O-[3-hydroxymyristoyl] N-acetylglucosamine deacetylase/3-hydroxyacyl-[acyl-carrier-protein] dehydratase
LQKTIQNKIQITGKGLHTGIITTACFIPAKPYTGIKFRRIDVKNKPYIDACVNNVHATTRRTVLKKNESVIETVEHVLAAVFALSISNLIIEVNGPELPILDGSSKIFIETLEKAGIKQAVVIIPVCNPLPVICILF